MPRSKKDWFDYRAHGLDISKSCDKLIRKLNIESRKPSPDLDKMIKLLNAIVFAKNSLHPFIDKYLNLKTIYNEKRTNNTGYT